MLHGSWQRGHYVRQLGHVSWWCWLSHISPYVSGFCQLRTAVSLAFSVSASHWRGPVVVVPSMIAGEFCHCWFHNAVILWCICTLCLTEYTAPFFILFSNIITAWPNLIVFIGNFAGEIYNLWTLTLLMCITAGAWDQPKCCHCRWHLLSSSTVHAWCRVLMKQRMFCLMQHEYGPVIVPNSGSCQTV